MSPSDSAHEFNRDRVSALVESKLAEVLGENVEGLGNLLSEILRQERIVNGWCDRCGGAARVRYPDYKGVNAVLDLLLGYVIGKPTERVEVQGSMTLRSGGTTKEQLAALTTAELEAIAAGRMRWPFDSAGKKLELEAGNGAGPDADAD